jgi:hypothetical protein
MAAVAFQKLRGSLVVALTEEIGLADGLVGEGRVASERRLQEEQSSCEKREAGDLPCYWTEDNGSAVSSSREESGLGNYGEAGTFLEAGTSYYVL